MCRVVQVWGGLGKGKATLVNRLVAAQLLKVSDWSEIFSGQVEIRKSKRLS